MRVIGKIADKLYRIGDYRVLYVDSSFLLVPSRSLWRSSRSFNPCEETSSCPR
jgi:hypothetical protein